MKRFTLILLVVLLAALMVTPALAAGGPPAGRQPFVVVGKITAIDAANATVTVNVLRGNVVGKPYIGKSIVIKTSATTRFLYNDGATVTTITFADLVVGKAVSAQGTLANNVWTASRVTMGAKLSCLP